MADTIVKQLESDGHYGRIAAINIPEPYSNACTGVLPLSTASVVGDESASLRRYFVVTHLEGTLKEADGDAKAADGQAGDTDTGGNEEEDSVDKVMGRPDTVYKICQMMDMHKNGKAVVAVVCTIKRQTSYNVSPAVAIDERNKALYIAYAPPPDLSAETIEERRPTFVAIEQFPISFDNSSGGHKLCVNKSESIVYRTPVQSRIPVRLFLHPVTGTIYMAANRSMSTLKPQARLFHCTHLTEETGKFLLQPVAGMAPDNADKLMKSLEFDASTAQASFLLPDRFYIMSTPCSVRDTDAAQYVMEEDYTLPGGPVLLEFAINIREAEVEGKADLAEMKLVTMQHAAVDRAVDFLYDNLSVLMRKPADGDAFKVQLRRSIYFVGTGSGPSDYLPFGFGAMPMMIVCVPCGDKEGEKPRFFGSKDVWRSMGVPTEVQGEDSASSTVKERLFCATPDGIYVLLYKEGGNELAGARVARARNYFLTDG